MSIKGDVEKMKKWEILDFCGPLDELLVTYPEKRVITVPCPNCGGFGGSVESKCDICCGSGSIQYDPEDCEVWR